MFTCDSAFRLLDDPGKVKFWINTLADLGKGRDSKISGGSQMGEDVEMSK